MVRKNIPLIKMYMSLILSFSSPECMLSMMRDVTWNARGLGLESSSYGSSFIFHKYSATFPRGESFDDHILNEVDMFSEKLRLEIIGNNEVVHALPHVTHNVETIVRSQ